MNETFEPRTERGLTSKAFNSPFKKSAKKNWAFVSRKSRNGPPELPSTIKSLGVGKKVYAFGPYRAELSDIKEFARMKNMDCLKMGAIKINL